MTKIPGRPSRKLILAPLLLVGMGLAVAGCRKHSPLESYSSIPPRYEQRHPIQLTRSTQTAMIDVSRHANRLNGMQHAAVESFVRSFRTDGSGSFTISVPAGGANEVNAIQISREIRSVASTAGIPANSITFKPYSAQSNVLYPPIIMSYGRVRAGVDHACGVVGNLDIGHENLPYENMGCASQANLAAMLSNPNDINTPRPMDKSDAARRYVVIDKYRAGSSSQSGSGSQAGK